MGKCCSQCVVSEKICVEGVSLFLSITSFLPNLDEAEQRSCEVARPSLWSRIGSRRILDCSALFRGRTFGPPCLQGFSLLHSTPWNVGNLRILRIFGVKICPFSVAHKSVICCSISWKTLSVSSAFHSLTEKHNFIEVYWLLRSQYTSKKASFIAIRVSRFYQVASWHI